MSILKKTASLSTASLLTTICIMLTLCPITLAKWEPAQGPLMTRWAKSVTPKNAHREYPRPQMVREQWKNLNGIWDYAITEKDATQPNEWQGEILVPYPIGSALSGVLKLVEPEQMLWYQRTFKLPKKWKGKNIILNFGAVDWDTTVWVNGKEIGNHKGGYDPFSFDITNALKESGEQQIVLSVWDPTDKGSQPLGKQLLNPGGIWYTRVNGIWQTVWLEPVPQNSIESLKITPDIDNSQVHIEVSEAGPIGGESVVEATVYDQGKEIGHVTGSAGGRLTIPIKKLKLWSPDHPFLYDLKVKLNPTVKHSDQVTSYFGMRKIALGKDSDGTTRMMLNNKTLFHYGPLDQGWWPDGLYTAASDKALKYDVEATKLLGCNMLRKHVKIEPARFYYYCDKIGLMVWQDMPSGRSDTPESKIQFDLELKRMIDCHFNSPSIVLWVPFNEGWGQHDTERITKWIKDYDPSRLVINASGWTDKKVGDIYDIHAYPGPSAPEKEENRAIVLGEFGGLGFPVKEHTWRKKKNWGYVNYKNAQELTDAYLELLDKLRPLIGMGLSGAVYTQTSDVEIEVNGLMTYDREIIKIDPKKVAQASRQLYKQPPHVKTIFETAMSKPASWRYTTETPPENWNKAGFDDSAWKSGLGGFGRGSVRNGNVHTEWTTPDIWIRRTFELKDADVANPYLYIFYEDETEVYINGELAATTKGRAQSYIPVPIEKQAAATLKKGTNTIAIHGKQKRSQQYIDTGLIDVIEK